ncbi:MAG: hypothetical protein UX44_C0005G0020 [candidate division WWE3 bacterium GW2011_GWA1_46_21]|uniref:BFN domain-containing protein n=3 Tax=Katanobacteria TaxID=422282 RepID=A0A0G1PFT2_UNCKA|nr:MAG: hypothetical protein UX44_C0005G0020 [candidate division WWE3 bacterium GW2011_GWA1_46_21]KKU51493.1 MAG: hypothetical protein UX73_C0001G0025 [candidate division WWE3 bacterium GW2011_GWC1_47_10]KKU57864.1 MAG: hypothetical protein UX79_C0004G0020 [candidate division WWE3 bacterium GW2011_GWB1_47_11]
MLTEVIIKAIAPIPSTDANLYSLYLITQNRHLALPIEISANAAKSLMLAVQKEQTPRPHVHDTMRRMAAMLNGKIKCAIINFYAEGIFYSLLRVERNSEVYDLDSKLTDALGVAVRCGAPIYIESNILEEHGIILGDI